MAFETTADRGKAFSDLERGLQTDIYDASDIMSFWEQQFEDQIGSSASWGMSPYLSMFTHGQYWGPPEMQWSVDPGQVYQAEESGKISGLLLRDELREERFDDIGKIGATGFAVSGVDKGPNLINKYYQDMGEVYQETDAALTDVYEVYGSAAENTLGEIMGVGGFSTDFAGGGGEIPAIYDELKEDYANWQQWEGSGTFYEQLENCVAAKLGSMELSSPYICCCRSM